ncbi:proton-dependent oligopeptide transporter, POT family [Chitinophaga costaii]|uniref:Proton-dependent oligopeptide transporter, POT family n=1 Tax=Chitinophaga costaii TaxID=1335309 RepID=A0A1C4DPT0_9BACT|nr:peptide MFS transporter [Chitinophaga costaii]PUZ27731.1 MFS transporter [Chitinophaga costaii]SCC33373.1 proton-dependent oligopeptide transporter, POT family [Chitinophaga costaii]
MQSTVAETGASVESSTKTWHPKGLFVLSSTEMWERFNFYGMRALLTLFLVNALKFSEADASIIYGGFLGLCYLTPMLGGYVADRYLGNRNCIILGGFVLSIGQLFMFASGATYMGSIDTGKLLMYIGLGVQILANGFFKPNISSMVGQLYPKADTRLDSAFTIFYMGINMGSLLGMAICPWLGDVKVDGVRVSEAFKWGFLAAAVAMLIGTILFYFLKNKYVVDPSGKPVGTKPTFTNKAAIAGEEAEKAHFTRPAILGCVALMVVLFLAIHYVSIDPNPIKSWVYPFIYAAGLTLAVLILTDKSITKIERDRILVMYVVAFFVIFFWACFEQAGSSLTFVADKQTDLHFLGYELPPSSLQNANSLFIIILALPFSLLWSALQKKKLEPISPVKQSIGLLMLSIGFLIIAQQVKNLGEGMKLGVVWMFVMYFFHTVGELCLSPIGLSLVSKLAPKRFTSLLMGVWFLANAAGYALAGTLGALLPPDPDKYKAAAAQGIDLKAVLDKTTPLSASVQAALDKLQITDHYPTFAGYTIHNLYEFFMVFVILPGAAAVLLFLLSGFLKKMMHGVR